jgi:excisionase family DNA binding protein
MLHTFQNSATVQSQTTLKQVAFEKFIDLKTAAKLLQLHPDTLKKKTRDGEIPGRKIGRQWRFRVSELDAWARSALVLPQPQSRRVI